MKGQDCLSICRVLPEALQLARIALRSRFALRVPLLSSLVMDLLHQRLQRAPTDLAQVALVVRHELLAVASAVDADARPPQIVVRFAQAAIANERRFRSHRQASYRQLVEGLRIS